MKPFPVRSRRTDKCGPELKIFFLSFFALTLVSLDALGREGNDDKVIFQNGDWLTGEVKRLDRGRLYFETIATGTIGIEWDKVAYLTSNQRFEIETDRGAIHFGSIVESEEPRQLQVHTIDGVISIPMDQVVIITPIEETRIGQIDIDITMGYNFTKASEQSQLNLAFDVNYRRERDGFGLSFDTVMTSEAVGLPALTSPVSELVYAACS